MTFFSHCRFSIPLVEFLKRNSFPARPVLNFFQFLMHQSHKQDGDYVTIYSLEVKEYFQEWDGGYAEAIRQLVEIGLLERNESYCCAKDKKDSTCMGYRLSKLGTDLFNDSNREYLKWIGTPKGKAVIKRSIRDRKADRKVYDDPVVQYIYKNLMAIDWDHEEAELIIENLKSDKKDSAKMKLQARSTLTLLRDKKFKDLECHPITGRLYTSFHSLPKELKRIMKVGCKPFCCELDVRCCHPSFFGLYLLSLDQDNAALKKEVKRYSDLFNSRNYHPREVIGDILGIQKDSMKKIMNQGLNGGRPKGAKKYFDWIGENYPEMDRVWRGTNLKQTGNEISRIYESRLFRNVRLVEKANELGISFLDNHDSVVLFGDRVAAGVFHEFLTDFAHELFGISVQIMVGMDSVEQEKVALYF